MGVQRVAIPTPDGEAPADLFTPEGSGPISANKWPGVLYLSDVWGIRPANQKMARRVAERGYAVLLPHLFYRTQPAQFDPFLTGAERSMALVQSLLAGMTAPVMTSDGVAYAQYLLARPEVSPGKIAVAGYCFSGAMALRIAAALPDKVAAVASFHGGNLVTDRPDSPHLLLPRIKAELYFGHADQDPTATRDQIATLEAALKQWGGEYHSELYEGALHGWSVEGRPDVYNPAQAERHFEKLSDLLKRSLK